MWYVATMMVRCRVGAQKTGPWTVEEQIHLIDAIVEDQAYQKALEFGKQEDHSYENVYGERVSWEFIGLEDLEWITEEPIQDGVEIRTRFLKRKDPDTLISLKSELTIFKSRHTVVDKGP